MKSQNECNSKVEPYTCTFCVYRNNNDNNAQIIEPDMRRIWKCAPHVNKAITNIFKGNVLRLGMCRNVLVLV